MPTTELPAPTATLPLVEQVRAATQLLETLAADWRLLDQLPADDRRRLHQAIAGLTVRDPRARRKRQKAAKAEDVRQDEAVLNETGIRALRRRPVVTTPNVFPPAANDERRTTNHERLTVERVCFMSARTRIRASTTSTISSALRAPTRTSPPAPSSRTCAVASHCSPAAA